MNIIAGIENQLKTRPFLKLVVPLILGICFNEFFFQLDMLICFSLLIILLFLLFYFHNGSNRKHSSLFGYLIFSFLFIVGAYLNDINNQKPTINTQHYSIKKAFCVKSIKIEPARKSYLFSSLSENKNFHFIVRTPQSFSPGDKILFNSKLKEFNHLRNPKSFNYKKYINRKGIYFWTNLHKHNYQLIGKHYSLLSYSMHFRDRIIKVFRKLNFDNDVFEVITALCLGYKSELSTQIKDSYSNAGALHVLAVSGLHVGIIAKLLSWLLFFLSKNKSLRLIKALLIVIILFSFAFTSGLSASVCRASLMFSLMIIGKSINRKNSIYNNIASSLFIFLLINCNYLFDLGFILSYVAVTGIVYLYPLINNTFYFKYLIPRYFWNITAVSISAQIAVLPISIFYFNKIPNLFFVSNLFVIIGATLLLPAGFFIFAFQNWETIVELLSKMIQVILKFLNQIINFISKIPFSTTEIEIDQFQFFILYMLILFLIITVVYKSKSHFYLSLYALIFLLIYSNYKIYEKKYNRFFIVYEAYKGDIINFVDAKFNYVLYNTDKSRALRVSGASMNTKQTQKVIRFDEGCITSNFVKFTNIIDFNSFKILILDNGLNLGNLDKVKFDIVLYSRNVKKSISNIKKIINFDKVIFMNEIDENHLKKLKFEATKEKVDYYSIQDNGAFIHKF